MIKIKIVNTKQAGENKALSANLGGILADSGCQVQLIEAEKNTTPFNFCFLGNKKVSSLKDLIANNSTDSKVNQSESDGQDMVVSEDLGGELRNWILDAPGGLVKLENMLSFLENNYDFMLIDSSSQDTVLQPSSKLVCGKVSSDLFLLPGLVKKSREIERVALLN